MRAFITQQMDNSEELRSNLKLAEGELADARKATNEVVELLRKVEKDKDAANAEARRLKDEGEAVKAKCKKIEEENK